MSEHITFTDIEFNPETSQTTAVVFVDDLDLGAAECLFVQP